MHHMKKSNSLHTFYYMPRSVGSAVAFTLIELLVAMTVFALFIAVLSSSYLMITRTERDTNEMRKLYSEGRFLMDEIVESVRGGEIAYECYGMVLTGDNVCDGSTYDSMLNVIAGNTLAVMRSDGKRTVLKAVECEDSEGCTMKLQKVVQEFNSLVNQWVPSNGDGYVSSGSDEGFQTVNLESIDVENMEFTLRPGLLVPGEPETQSVSVSMTLTKLGQLRETISFPLQTTISLRNY